MESSNIFVISIFLLAIIHVSVKKSLPCSFIVGYVIWNECRSCESQFFDSLKHFPINTELVYRSTMQYKIVIGKIWELKRNAYSEQWAVAIGWASLILLNAENLRHASNKFKIVTIYHNLNKHVNNFNKALYFFNQ